MIQDQDCPRVDHAIFTDIEALEQLRNDIITVHYRDQAELTSTLQEQTSDLKQTFQLYENKLVQSDQILQKLENYLNQFTKHSSQHFRTIKVIIHLTVQMIDFIISNHHRQGQIAYEHQMEVDQLKNQIQFLSSKSTFIENDVQIFREQLRAAQNELDDITQNKHENPQFQLDFHQIQVRENEKNKKIQLLQLEVQRIKDQLNQYKFQSQSKKSNFIHWNDIKNSQKQFKCAESEETYAVATQLARYKEIIYNLQNQNQNLREYIAQIKKQNQQTFNLQSNKNIINSKIKLGILSQQNQNLIDPTTDIHQQSKTGLLSPNWLCKNTSLTLIHKSKELLQLQPKNQQISENINSKQLTEQFSSKLQTYHRLNSDWGGRSFQIRSSNAAFDDIIPQHLIYLDQQSFSQNQKTKSFNFNQSATALESKYTDTSVKQSVRDNYLMIKQDKNYCTIGVNTARNSIDKIQKILSKRKFKINNPKEAVNKSQPTEYSLLNSICNFVVNRRVKRNSKKANSGIGKISFF